MQVIDKETLLEMIREDGAEDWQSVVNALEDGEYLEALGVGDESVNAVEDAHDHAQLMADSHPDHKF